MLAAEVDSMHMGMDTCIPRGTSCSYSNYIDNGSWFYCVE